MKHFDGLPTCTKDASKELIDFCIIHRHPEFEEVIIFGLYIHKSDSLRNLGNNSLVFALRIITFWLHLKNALGQVVDPMIDISESGTFLFWGEVSNSKRNIQSEKFLLRLNTKTLTTSLWVWNNLMDLQLALNMLLSNWLISALVSDIQSLKNSSLLDYTSPNLIPYMIWKQ